MFIVTEYAALNLFITHKYKRITVSQVTLFKQV